MSVVLIIVAVALAVGGLVTWTQARGQRWRWGWRAVTTPAVGEGLYRSADVTLRAPRSIPLVCTVAAVTSAAWGMLTLFVFMPAGMLGCTVAAPYGASRLLGVIGFLGLTVVILHAFPLGTALMGLARILTRRPPNAAALVARTAKFSLAHHAVVAAVFATCFPVEDAVWWALLAGVPCAIGLAHAGLLLTARAALIRLDLEDAARDRTAPGAAA